MPSFNYYGRDSSGEAVNGTLELASMEMAAAALRELGVTPIRITPGRDQPAQAAAGGERRGRERSGKSAGMTRVELQLFSRQLHALLRGGLPILRALTSMKESATRPALAAMMEELCASLDQGRELSTTMSRFPRDFPALYVAMIRVGEQTGKLDAILKQLSAWLDFERKSAERVKEAIRYPTFVIAAMAVAIVVVNVFVIPRFASVYKSMKVELPLMTKILLGFSKMMVEWWPVMLVGGAVAWYLARTWRRSQRGGEIWDRYILKMPIAGKILLNTALARFARSMSMTLRSGLPAAQGIQLVANTVGNAWLASRMERVRVGIERGESLLRACSATRAFTPLVLQMIAVGEESGTVDEMLEQVAIFYEEDVEYDLAKLSSAIEPILILVLGAIVLVLALGIFLPIWDLGKATMHK